MSHIIINEKNFQRFSNRMRNLLNEFTNGQISLGKLQSQEIFSQILGSENVHELRINLNKEKIVNDYTFKLNKNEVNDFFASKLHPEQEKEFITKLEKRMGYICARIADISGYDFCDWSHALKSNENSPSLLNCIAYSYSPKEQAFKEDMKESIRYNIEYLNKKVISYDKYIRDFPTTWLFEDFEPVLIEEVKQDSFKQLKSGHYSQQLRPKIK